MTSQHWHYICLTHLECIHQAKISNKLYCFNVFANKPKTQGFAFKSTYLWTKGLKILIWPGSCTLVQKWTNFCTLVPRVWFQGFPGFQLGFLVSQGYKCNSTLFLGTFYNYFPKAFRFSQFGLGLTPLISIQG